MSDTSSPFVSLASVLPEEQAWLWRGRIPLGAITVLEGHPGQGKSLITCDWMARVTRGRSFPGDELTHEQLTLSDTLEFPVPAGVVLLEAEDDLATTVVPRLNSAGADLSRVLAWQSSRSAERPWRLPHDVPLLEQAIRDVQACLVVIDPLTAFLPAGIHGDSQVRRALQPLAELAQRTGCAVVLVRHLVKDSGRHALSKGAGSMGIIGLARSALAVEPLPEDFDPRRDVAPFPIQEPPAGSSVKQSRRFTHLLTVVKGNLGHAPPLLYRTDHERDGSLRMHWLGIHEPHQPDTSDARSVSSAVRTIQDPLRPVRADQARAAGPSRGLRWLRHGWTFLGGAAQGIGRGAICLCRTISPKRRKRRRR